MKVEHKEAIDRARRHGMHPMTFAHELMVHDLVDAALFELRNIKVPFSRLGEDDQQEVIDRITKIAEEAVSTAVGIISTRSVDTIPMTVVDAKFKAKAITVTASIDAQDPNRHGLIDVAGKLCLMVLAPNDYAEGTDGIRAERDQYDLPLSASEIIAGAGLDRKQEQRHTEPVTEQAPVDDSDAVDAELVEPRPEGKVFGGFTYEDAANLVSLHAQVIDVAWLQRRLSIDSESASSLLLRLLDDKVIELESEAEDRLEYKYRVVATLADVAGLELE
ncbi:DNA translocase FtsK [Pseudomonas guariconensis]|uniref:DNA translocase FtsK n=1 Tax=Pseudomonas TaxID=286 RepID=UPI0020982C1F|nr:MULTISPECIES: DNA translocase FtsK [Pseudomonas]MCO7513750.1 DNA translocase FtsK [Pseudomonas putida]MCO7603849.1 DNA translocase FtsK [Pseudomonas guariconensis]